MLVKENVFLSSFLYSWGYESSCKTCSAVEQVLCRLLHNCSIFGPIVLFPIVCAQGKRLAVCFVISYYP